MSDAKQLTFIVELEKSCPGIKCCKFELGRDEFADSSLTWSPVPVLVDSSPKLDGHLATRRGQ